MLPKRWIKDRIREETALVTSRCGDTTYSVEISSTALNFSRSFHKINRIVVMAKQVCIINFVKNGKLNRILGCHVIMTCYQLDVENRRTGIILHEFFDFRDISWPTYRLGGRCVFHQPKI